MASSGVNVLRYSFLFGGISYGLYHQRSIWAKAKQDHERQEYKKQQSLIEQAKAAWLKKISPPSDSSTVISDPNDPNFDLEAVLTAQMADTVK
ncbi:MAG: hypothetical protein Q9190_001479 [Brigantiaea leucoxantha]